MSQNYSPKPLANLTEAAEQAGEFAELAHKALSATLTERDVVLSEHVKTPWQKSVWTFAHDAKAILVPLADGTFFRFGHALEIIERRDKSLFLATKFYTYVWTPDPVKPMLRWEFKRKMAKADLARGHFHVHGTPDDYTGDKPFVKLHIPTGRLTFEEILRFLVVEMKVPPRNEHWRDVLAETTAAFEEIQRRRVLADDATI